MTQSKSKRFPLLSAHSGFTDDSVMTIAVAEALMPELMKKQRRMSSSTAWLFDDLETTRKIARWIAEVTHNHPEGIKGAEAVALAR